MQADAIRAARVVPAKAAIVAVLQSRRGSKVGPSVVELRSVAMIDFVLGPFARHVKPRELLCEVAATVDLDTEVAPRDGAALASPAMALERTKFARLGIVVQHFVKARECQHQNTSFRRPARALIERMCSENANDSTVPALAGGGSPLTESHVMLRAIRFGR